MLSFAIAVMTLQRQSGTEQTKEYSSIDWRPSTHTHRRRLIEGGDCRGLRWSIRSHCDKKVCEAEEKPKGIE